MIETAGCDSFAVNNEIYYTSGQYIQHLPTETGCDSVLNLLLTINHTQYSQLTVNICPGEEFDGYSEAGVYQDTFFTSHGCDSIRTLMLNVLSPNDPSCIASSTTALTPGGIFIYPNPTDGEVFVQHSDPTYTSVQIFSLDGKMVYESNLNSSTVISLLDQPAGIFVLRFRGADKSLILRLQKD